MIDEQWATEFYIALFLGGIMVMLVWWLLLSTAIEKHQKKCEYDDPMWPKKMVFYQLLYKLRYASDKEIAAAVRNFFIPIVKEGD